MIKRHSSSPGCEKKSLQLKFLRYEADFLQCKSYAYNTKMQNKVMTRFLKLMSDLIFGVRYFNVLIGMLITHKYI